MYITLCGIILFTQGVFLVCYLFTRLVKATAILFTAVENCCLAFLMLQLSNGMISMILNCIVFSNYLSSCLADL